LLQSSGSSLSSARSQPRLRTARRGQTPAAF